MRLINSDSQIVDARVIAKGGGNAASSSARIDGGVVVLGAAVFVMLITVAVASWAVTETRATRDLMDARAQAWQMAFDAMSARQHDTDTSAKLLERRYMDFSAYAMLNGWKVEGDGSFGPTGNLKRMAPQEKQHGR
jgi:hypothetical protein